ncbi:hypothetical protein DNTS_011352 [Danionella cerebrum]|uniref:PHD-type domain-containing protein n=1 Tax=Danionella cerebrum TaxID=2873325 RepID=A0A553QX92_9TELE|nr:hypothetical protein DNTS_011352 [Danionella translucida]
MLASWQGMSRLPMCDECRLCYHFGCLDPPLKKSPKQAGYGWICQECDSSSSKIPIILLMMPCLTLFTEDNPPASEGHIPLPSVRRLAD